VKPRSKAKEDLIDKMSKLEAHIKKMRQLLEDGQLTKDNYVAIEKAAFLVDRTVWDIAP
jgi:hypothetical protein